MGTDLALRELPAGRELCRWHAVFARINWSRNVVDCPNPNCSNAMTLRYGDAVMVCSCRGGCGWATLVIWPDNYADIVGVLMLRPDPFTRDWLPGESLMDLINQNLMHGIHPTRAELEAAKARAGDRPLLLVEDDRIVHADPVFGITRRVLELEG